MTTNSFPLSMHLKKQNPKDTFIVAKLLPLAGRAFFMFNRSRHSFHVVLGCSIFYIFRGFIKREE